MGTALIAALVGLCWLEWTFERPGLALLPLALVVGWLAAGEFVAMLRAGGYAPVAAVVYVGTLAAIVAAGSPAYSDQVSAVTSMGGVGLFAMVFAACFVATAIAEMRRYDESGKATVNLALTMLAVLYVGGLMSFLVQLRLYQLDDDREGRWGLLVLVTLVAIVKLSDIGQYTAGRLFGRNKLAPRVSPGKTWEGAVGGIVFACAAAWLMAWEAPRLLGPYPFGLTYGRFTAYAIVLAVAGMLGDLVESMFKRDAGVKDSSAWMPGFGGVLDLLDSLLVAAPVAYLFWAMGWIGP